MATEHFGMLTGVCNDVSAFPSLYRAFLNDHAHSNVSNAYKRQDKEKLRVLLQKSMSFTVLYEVPCHFCHLFLCGTFDLSSFSSTSAAYYLKLLCPYFLFIFLSFPYKPISSTWFSEGCFHSYRMNTHIVAFLMMYIPEAPSFS